MSDGTMQMNVKPLMDQEDRGGPMEVDAVWSKGGKKGGKKGKKGKEKGKNSKGKGSWSKDGGKKGGKGGKGSGKQDGKKGKTGVGNCHNCGKPGHFARECWAPKRVSKVEDQEAAEVNKNGQVSQSGKDQGQSGGASTGPSSHSTYRAGVRRVRLVTPTGLATMEIFDLTQDDSPDEPVQSEDEEMAWAINMVMEVQNNALEEEEVFYDCHSGDEDEPPSTSSLEETGSHDARAQCEDTELDMFRVCMVKSVAPTVIMTLDSGADVPVAPEEYYQMGQPGQQRSVQMVDAQGEAIKSAGNRRLRLQAHTRSGEMVEFVEQFALGVGVTHPLLSFGRLLRQGWVLSRDHQGLCLEHPEKKMQIPARLERNSLVMDVKVCAIRAEEDVDEEQKKEIEAMAANDRAQAMNEGEERKEEKKIPEEAEADRGVKRSAEEQIELERVAKEEDETLAVMKELSEQVVTDDDVQVEENPMKKSRLKENEDIPQRSPGYTTEESGGEIMVEGSSSEDGRVQEKMARWEKWRLKKIEVKSEPMELTDSPMEELTEAGQHVFPVRGEGHSLQGFISREVGLLEKVPGWHALPNGIVVHSSPQATHFLDPSMSFGPEWCGRMTLVKKKDNSGAWEQIESLAAYRDTPLPFRALPAGPRSALTFVAPGLIRDYFVLNSEVPVSQYPLLSGEPSSWPDDERDEEGGEFPMLAAGSGGRAEILEDVEFVDPDELRVQIDETWFDKETKLKDLQEICKQLGLATSGSKTKVLRRLQRFKHQQEEKMAYEVAQRLFAESRREAIPLKTPKLPSRHEQELRQLTHLPFQPWCQQCVATRSKEDPRMKEDQSDRKDRGRPVISFDCGFTYTADAPEEKQWGTALYVAESESKATLCIPVQAKGSASLKQVTEELTRFSMQVCNTQPIIFQSDGERATRQVLRAIQHARASLGLTAEVRTTSRDQHASNSQAERAVQSVRKLANTLRQYAEEKSGVKITGDMHCYPWSFRHAAWLMLRYRVINGATSCEMLTDRQYVGRVALWGETVLFKDVTSFKRKGEPVYRRGVWVGKSSWSDSHICLTRSEAVEARSIRRLPDQFDGQMLIHCRGLPWQYSVQGILMKTKFAARQRLAEAAEEATGEEQVEKEAKMVGEEVAMRMYGHGPITPGPAPEGYPKTPARTPAAPTPASKTPALRTPVVMPMPATPARSVPKTPAPEPPREAMSSSSGPKEAHQKVQAEEIEVPKRKMARLPIPEAMRGEPARNFMPEALDSETSPKKQRLEEIVGNLAPVTPPLGTKREYALPWDDEDVEKRRMSPKRRVNSIQEDFPGGDELSCKRSSTRSVKMKARRKELASHLKSMRKS